MISRTLRGLLPLLCLLSCTSATPGPVPVDLDELAPAVTDVQLSEALLIEVPVLLRDSLQQVFYERALADNGYDSVRFDAEMWLVRQEPEWVDSLLRRVEEEVARRKAGLRGDPDRPARLNR